uniref:NB-ARC domain-containing protein n=1 Tax=Leersia perrieri TaxID=77586 RepID=A0A0D9X4I5_9ORYZ
MAEGVVFAALCKIGSVLASSASITLGARLDTNLTIINEIENRIKQIEVELKLMQAFLRQAQKQEGYSEPTEVYLQEVRKAAFEIEDIIDEFLYLSVKHKSRFFNGEFMSYFRKLGKTSWHRIATELKDLQSHLQNLRNLRVQYEIQLPNGSKVSTDVEDHRLPHHLSYPADEMVGVEQERTMIMHWLNATTNSTSVITVWGMGGSGKTTLVNGIYEDERIKNHFDCHIWITVSQKFHASDIMRKMIQHILQKWCPSNIDSIDGRDLVEILKKTLEQRKILLVLDDVWSTDVWMDLAGTVGRSNNNGNKVIITTRIKEVASLASEDQVLELQKLNEADSWRLFCRWAFKNHIDRSCPQELEPLGREIMGKCDGLPLAIVVVGNMISFKKQDMEEWSKCNDQLTWELRDRLRDQELSSVMKILKLSYKHLPSHLKNAFVFCSIFPEDYIITKKRLARLWVAEGLIKPEKRRTTEEVAEEYLNELIDRCLLQVVERKHFRKVKEFQMHDIVRELTISISEKETFCMTHNKSQHGEHEYRCRRLSIHEHNDRIKSISDPYRLRSLYHFDVTCSSFPSVGTPRSARYLNALELQDVPITVLPEELSGLFNLRYLGLRRTKIKQLPQSIYKLFNLQTLDIYLTNVDKLPTGITKLKRLRHLLAGKLSAPLYCGIVEKSRGVEAPKTVWESMELQTLKGVLANMDLVEHLGNMTQLRTLAIEDIVGAKLEKLYLTGSKMNIDPLISISCLSNLKVLQIGDAYDGQSVVFQRGWFTKLHTLIMCNLSSIGSMVMEEQTLQSLQWLALVNLPELKKVPRGIEFVRSLKNLMLVNMHDEFMEHIQGEDKFRNSSENLRYLRPQYCVLSAMIIQ